MGWDDKRAREEELSNHLHDLIKVKGFIYSGLRFQSAFNLINIRDTT